MKLESEFEQYKAQHKFCILKAMMMRYFETLESGQVDLPEFCKDIDAKHRYELLAMRELKHLITLGDNLEKFNSLYEKAWSELAPVLD